jgi:hypothetical protein
MSRSPVPRHGLFEALPGQVLGAVDHDRLQPLVEREARARVLAVMDALTVPVHTVCYECRLAGADPRVDIAVALFPAPDADPAGVLGELGRRRREDPAWRRCLALLERWSAPGSAPDFPAHAPRPPARSADVSSSLPRSPAPSLVPAIPFVCVAFDGPGEPATLPAPALSLCVDPDLFARQLGLPAPRAAPPAQISALADACAADLLGAPLPTGCRAAVERCLSGDGVVARHISFMVSRSPATFKLDVRLPVDGVAPLLHRIGWPGDVPRVVAGIRDLMPWPGHVQLNLVLHPALAPSLEVELLTGAREARAADRMALLDTLVAAGHCAPAKAAALRDAWIHPVSRDRGGLVVARSWYLKVRFAGDRIAEAKAYLGLMPRGLDGRAAATAPAPAPPASVG